MTSAQQWPLELNTEMQEDVHPLFLCSQTQHLKILFLLEMASLPWDETRFSLNELDIS